MKYNPVDEARKYDFIRESGGQNRGQSVEAIQRWNGGLPGQSWCAYFVLFILDICFGGKSSSPVVRSGAVQAIYDQAKKNNWVTSKPIPGDMFIYVDASDHAHHIGFYTGSANGVPVGIAGNTSADGSSSNGDRVAEHTLTTNPARIKYIHYF